MRDKIDVVLGYMCAWECDENPYEQPTVIKYPRKLLCAGAAIRGRSSSPFSEGCRSLSRDSEGLVADCSVRSSEYSPPFHSVACHYFRSDFFTR